MASIERLQVSGIRSFNPDPARAQTVNFQKPLTVILGKNGAGKTTIIEALLNACAGAMPPGSGGAEKSSFVYDPKVFGESEVKAQIRLIFTSKDGRNMQVIRSVQVSRSRSRTELKTLDNTVAYQDPATGKVVSHTYRASDVDRVVPQLLGVSPSVLKYVVFCHQEESNWPLAPPKEVKEIFDDLFAATRYVQALEQLRKISQDLKKGQKEHEASLLALREYRSQAQDLEESITKKEEVIKLIEDRKAGLEPELVELRKASAALDAVEQQAEALTKEAAQLTGRMDEKRDTIARADLPSPMHTLEQLVELRDSLNGEAKSAQATITHTTQQAAEAQTAARHQEEEVYSQRAQVQYLEREDVRHRKNVADLQDLLRQLQRSANGGGAGGSGEDEEMHFVLGEDSVDVRSLNRLMDFARAAAESARAEAQAAQKQWTDSIEGEEAKRQLVLRAMDADRKERELITAVSASLMQQIKDTRDAIRSLDGDGCEDKLAHEREEVGRLERRVEAAEALARRGERAEQRQHLVREFDEQNNVVARLRHTMAGEKQRLGRQGDVDRLKERLDRHRAALDQRLEQQILPRMEQLSVKLPDSTSNADSPAAVTSCVRRISESVEEVRQRKEHELRSAREMHSVLDRRVAALEQKRVNLLDQIATHTAELSESNAACEKVLLTPGLSEMGAGDLPAVDRYEELLDAARTSSELAAQRKHALTALSACYAEFAEAAKQSNRCEVCERTFADSKDLQQFIERNEEKQQASPEATHAADLEVAHCHERLRQLESIQKSIQNARRIQALLPALEEELGGVETTLQTTSTELLQSESSLNALIEQLGSFTQLCFLVQSTKSIADEMGAVVAQLADKERALADERAGASAADRSSSPSSPADGDGARRPKTYEELTEEYEEATSLLHRLNEQLAELQRMEEGSGASAAEKELLAHRHAMYQLEATVSKVVDLRAAAVRLQEDLSSREATLKALQLRGAEQERQLADSNKTLHRLREQREASERAVGAAAAAAEDRLRQLDGAVPSVREYVEAGNGTRLSEARAQLRTSETALRQSKEEAERLERAITAARDVLAEHDRRAAQIDRTMTVVALEESLQGDAARLQEVEKMLRELQGNRLSNVERLLGDSASNAPLPRVREMIRAKVSELERAQAQQEGNVEAMLQDVNGLKGQRSMEKYSNIEKRYRSTFLKAQTTAVAAKDVDNYYGALELAVQTYHQEKIAQINQIIAELWRQTYKGSDIDTVEIRSETEATSSSAAKRTYSYRVVIKRGSSELDMRGRCSAGQKVLASIIIRLALSEAFCLDCGILALDEPTTNLDEDNARSLAESLRSLIELKRNVKSFQLVVITHDEQFVRALGGHHLEHFYYVHKDREGAFSVIERRTFQQLFT